MSNNDWYTRFRELVQELTIAALNDGACGCAAGNHPMTDRAQAALIEHVAAHAEYVPPADGARLAADLAVLHATRLRAGSAAAVGVLSDAAFLSALAGSLQRDGASNKETIAAIRRLANALDWHGPGHTASEDA